MPAISDDGQVSFGVTKKSQIVNIEPNGRIVAICWNLSSAFLVVTDPTGEVMYFDMDLRLHREDGPAYIDPFGYMEYKRHGERHRSEGPVQIDNKGNVSYAITGRTHRIKYPSVITENGSMHYYCSGSLHNINGPAKVTDYMTEYFENGMKHNLDGPAIIDIRNNREWYFVNDRVIDSEKEWQALINIDITDKII